MEINDASVIVGVFIDNSGNHGFMLREGHYTAIDVPGSNFTNVYGINASGHFVGGYIDADLGRTHGFVAMPILEPPQVITVSIDIKPGESPNSINLNSRGIIPVAILTTETFDATIIDPLSMEFGPNGATEAHEQGHIEDVDGDSDDDLVLH